MSTNSERVIDIASREWVIIKLPVTGPAEMAESAIPKKSSFTSKNKPRPKKSSQNKDK